MFKQSSLHVEILLCAALCCSSVPTTFIPLGKLLKVQPCRYVGCYRGPKSYNNDLKTKIAQVAQEFFHRLNGSETTSRERAKAVKRAIVGRAAPKAS